MKDYRSILEISADATEEQIKAQYKRLVRIYHPDRFTNSDDKLYVEQKLQEINEAYRALLNPVPNTFLAEGGGSAPQPVALPTVLDFGELPWGRQQTLVFHVENSGGTVQSLQLEYSDVDGWFKVTKGRRLHAHQPFPMEFAVVVDTARLEVGKSYQGWIQIRMDNAATRVALAVKVAAKQPLSLLSPRLAMITSLVALLLMIVLVQPFELTGFWPAQLPFSLFSARSGASAGVMAPALSVDTPIGAPATLEVAVQLVTPTAIEDVMAVAVAISPAPATVAPAQIRARTGLTTVQSQASPTTKPDATPSSTLTVAERTTATTPPHSTPLPQPTTSIRPVQTGIPGTLVVTIPDNYYVNGRAESVVEAPVLQILPSGSQWVATGRTPDAGWLQLQVAQDAFAWVAATTVVITGDVDTLPVIKE